MKACELIKMEVPCLSIGVERAGEVVNNERDDESRYTRAQTRKPQTE